MAQFRKTSFAASASAGALAVASLVAATPALAQATAPTQPVQQSPQQDKTSTGQAVVPNQATPPENTTDPIHGETPPTETGDQPPADPGAPAQPPADTSDVVVTGFRASLENALNQKRRSNQIIDAITAEDIADFPDANLAESIQRLPGVSIDRDNGEGRSVTIRGLGGDFQMVRLNGADAQAVAGGNQSDSGANRTRGFDFNTFASELFGGIKVTKSTAAMNDEGSLGAIIDLTTGRPLSFKTDRIALGLEGEYRENGKSKNPRLTALLSKRLSDEFGILGSIAWQDQGQQIDAFQRSSGQFEYLYRNSQHAGKTPPTFGFAQPGNAAIPTFGSDPAAYALLSPTSIIPALPSIGRRDLQYDRFGSTLTAQWRPTSRTEIILDGVYSRYRQESINYGITPVGLNRNNTNTRFTQGTLRDPSTTNGLADRFALYPRCIVTAAHYDCGESLYGGALVPGTRDSFNPLNLNPFDYYNSTVSPGYIPSANLTAGYVPLLGRPNTKVREVHVNEAGQADYLVLDDVDWRSSADSQAGKTVFKQATANFTHEFTDNLRADATLGWSKSSFRATGLLAEFNTTDRDNYVFDAREGEMPVLSPGFAVDDPNQWDLVKGLSTIRLFKNRLNNEFKVGRLNFAWEVAEPVTLRVGATWKQYDFDSLQVRREQDIEDVNPTLLEARQLFPNLTMADLGQVVGFGEGLEVSQGTPTSFFAPSLDAFRRVFGIDCNCINVWGDYRAILDGREINAVQEKDLSGFVQADFEFDVLGNSLRGDIGLRVARTSVLGKGSVGGSRSSVGLPVEANHRYTDWLPSTNIVYEPMRDLLVRFAASKTMARPMLRNLTPGTTSFSSGLNATNAPTVTVGNPYLSPFRARNLDLSVERYFGRNGILALTLFHKKLKSFPQQLAGEMPLSAVFEEDIYEQIVANMTSSTLRAYTEAEGVWAVRQFQDAPGGTIKGFEVNAQSNLSFLPAPFDNLGITANYTYINSELTYLTGTRLATRRDLTSPPPENQFATGPFLNTSPHAFNATLYYEDDTFSARVSGAYRKRYVNRFPLSTGTCSVGIDTNGGAACNSPVVADFGYTEDTMNVDAALAYNLTKALKLTLEGRNLTNEKQYRTMYEANPVTQTYSSTGRIFTAGIRAVF